MLSVYHLCPVSLEDRRVIRIRGIGVIDGCELSCAHWDCAIFVQCPWRPGEGIRICGIGVIDNCGLPGAHWDGNLGALEEEGARTPNH